MAILELRMPGPKSPSWLQALNWVYRPVAWMESCAKRFPDAFHLHLPGSRHTVMLTNPELIAELFALDGQTAAAGKANALLRPVVGDNSMLLLDGLRHQRERKLMMPPFHGDRMRAYAQTMAGLTEAQVVRWPMDSPFVLHEKLQALTLEIIIRVVFGVDQSDEADELRSALRAFLQFSQRPSLLLFMRRDGTVRGEKLQRIAGPLAPRRRFLSLLQKTDEVLYGELRRRRTQDHTGREDILSMLFGVRDEQGNGMSDIELRDELMTLLVAGHETTATSLSWTLAELVEHPEVLARVREELAREVGAAPLDASHLPKLKYLDAVITESLRLRPVVPIVARILERDVKLGSFELPQGTMVCPCIFITHRRPDIYPEPHRFDPARWLGVQANPSAYFPFGGGARRCLGRAFALFEMKVVLAQLLPRIDLRFAEGYRPRMVRRSITLAPSEGVRVVASTPVGSRAPAQA